MTKIIVLKKIKGFETTAEAEAIRKQIVQKLSFLEETYGGQAYHLPVYKQLLKQLDNKPPAA